MEKRYELKHNPAEHRYEFDLGNGAKAFITYVEGPDALFLTHTIVPEEYEGQGIAAELTVDVLEELKRQKRKIIPHCSYIIRWIERHPEWQGMWYKE